MNETVNDPCTKIVPIGGVGVFGANATVVETAQASILIDFGLMFPPNKRQPGVEFYINDPQMLMENFPYLSAIFVTHAHEDHIGGLGFLLEHKPLPIYTTAYTARIIEHALDYHDVKKDIRVVELGEEVHLGDLSVRFIGVTHSIVGATSLLISTPDGNIIHSGDFKVDALPGDNYPFQSNVFRKAGDEGIDLLIMDSTNATKPGFCPSDYEIQEPLGDLLETAPGRVFLTTFSSHMPRIRKLVDIAQSKGRKIAFVGRSFRKHFKACLDTAYMGTEAQIVVDEDTAAKLPHRQVLYIVAGSQAEARSALASIGNSGFRGLKFEAGDRLIFSSRSIPGNERQVMLFISEMERRGIDVISSYDQPVHTSGHGFREDVAYLLRLTRPKYVAPIHGEFHHLLGHHRWLHEITDEDQEVLLLEDGDVVTMRDGQVRNHHKISCSMIPIDGNQNCPISSQVLKQRRDLMYSGMVLVCCNASENGYRYEVNTHGACEPEPGAWASQLEQELKDLALDLRGDRHVHIETIFRCARTVMKRLVSGKPVIKMVMDGRIVK